MSNQQQIDLSFVEHTPSNVVDIYDNVDSRFNSVEFVFDYDVLIANVNNMSHPSLIHMSPTKHDTRPGPKPLCPDKHAPDASMSLKRPDPSTELKTREPDLVKIYDTVRSKGVPNYRGARVTLSHGIKVQAWRERAHMYNDPSLADMLEFGFPSGHLSDTLPTGGLSNHASTLRNPEQVKKFLYKECRLKAMKGPFTEPPLTQWWRNNPLMTER